MPLVPNSNEGKKYREYKDKQKHGVHESNLTNAQREKQKQQQKQQGKRI